MRTLAAIAGAALLAACATTGPGGERPPAAPAATPPLSSVPPAYQYLFGSGEGGAEALTAFHALIAYAEGKAAHQPIDSVVLAAGSPLVHAHFVPCGDKPLAVVFDIDETLVLNLGFEARAATGVPYRQAEWDAFEQGGGGTLVANPGAVHAVEDLRKMGVTVVFNTNRKAANAERTIASLKALHFGDAVHGQTLFLQGDDVTGSHKDGRRATIAASYCVIAMAGDQLGDFSDLFNAPMPVAERRQLAVQSSAAGLWGKGWFILPNPVYGSALKGGMDDLFPADKRWSPAMEK